MNAISSLRPFGDSPSIAANQLDALETWVKVFDRIILFGEPEEAFNPSITEFVPCEGKPTIKSMAEHASTLDGFTAILNSDIQLEIQFKGLTQKLYDINSDCAYSFRIPIGKHKPEDMGIDVFVANQRVWKSVTRIIPEYFHIGKIQWDTWLVSYFVNQHRCSDFTPLKAVYHPNHQERNDQSVKVDKNDWYLNNVKLAARKVLP